MDREQILRWIRWMVFPIMVVTFAIYVGIAVILSLLALVSLVDGAALLLAVPGSPSFSTALLDVLHAVLLTIIIVEILETVLVYFRTSRVQVRPILIAGLTAMVRRVIVMGVESVNTLDILATAVVIAVLTAAVLLVGKEEGEPLVKG
jgi:uncharacterized membrane protein (DUF373 family)